MNPEKVRREMLICPGIALGLDPESASRVISANTWERIWPHVFVVEGLLLLPVVSLRFELRGGMNLSTSDLQQFLSCNGGFVHLLET